MVLQSQVSAAPLAIVKNQDLDFGTFALQGTSGTVTISATGTRNASAGVALLTSASVSPARFTITGNSGATYSLAIPATSTVTFGGNTMTLTSLNASVPTTGTLPTTGSLSFSVGATISLNNSQPKGAYSGTFTVSVGK